MEISKHVDLKNTKEFKRNLLKKTFKLNFVKVISCQCSYVWYDSFQKTSKSDWQTIIETLFVLWHLLAHTRIIWGRISVVSCRSQLRYYTGASQLRQLSRLRCFQLSNGDSYSHLLEVTSEPIELLKYFHLLCHLHLLTIKLKIWVLKL